MRLLLALILIILLSQCSTQNLNQYTVGLTDWILFNGSSVDSSPLLFENGGFETWSGIIPEGLMTVTFVGRGERFDYITSNADARNGNTSVQVTRLDGHQYEPFFFRVISVNYGDDVFFRFYAKTLSGAPKIKVQIFCYDKGFTKRLNGDFGKSGSLSTPANEWTEFYLNEKAGNEVAYMALGIYANTASANSGTFLLDDAIVRITNYPPIAPKAGFNGIYSSITDQNYPDDFHGETTIAEIRNALDGGAKSGMNWNIKGVITGLGNYNGAFSSYSFWVQDSTGGIYFNVSEGVTAVTADSVGKVFLGTLTAGTTYNGIKEITAVSGTPIVTTEGAPTEQSLSLFRQPMTNRA